MRGKRGVSYIGVTGFMNLAEVKTALEAERFSGKRDLMVGVLMSSKTLRGIPNKWPGRYPKKENVAGIFSDHTKALNLIHYNTDSPEKLFFELLELTELGGPNLDGFQLNIPWPDLAIVCMYRSSFPKAYLVLQIGRKALEEVGYSPKELVKKAKPYCGFVDCFLIDFSDSKGIDFNVNQSFELLAALKVLQLGIVRPLNLGIAGGLGPNHLLPLVALLPAFPDLCWDAEGKLRTPKPEDALDLPATLLYISKSYLFERQT